MNRLMDIVSQRLPVQKILQRLKIARHDELGRERGQTLVRAAIVLTLIAYLGANGSDAEARTGIPVWLLFCIGLLALACVTMWAAFRATRPSLLRRTTTNIADTVAISGVMIFTGAAGIPLFSLYLWATLGYGFRYGLTAMGISAVLTLIGFAVVVWLTPAWQYQPMFALGVLLALAILPMYAAHLMRMLNNALTQAAKGQFLDRVHHELQSPLKGILGAAQGLEKNRQLTLDERSQLRVIVESAQASLNQIGNALDFTRLETGKLVIEPTPFDLYEILNVAIETLRPLALQKSMRVLARVAPETPYRLIGDSRYLRDVLLHLLSSVTRLTDNGAIYVDVSGRDESAQRASVRVEIRHTGNGPGTNALSGAFDDAAMNLSAGVNGTALEISIAQRLVGLMHGRIGFEAESDRTGVLWLEIPFEKQSTPSEATLSDLRVLLLSEEPGAMDHFQRVITDLHGTAIAVTSGKDALDVLSRSIRLGNPVQALLIDVGAALATDTSHRLGELCEKAMSTRSLVILVSDFAPPATRLRAWGYNTVLSRRAAPDHVYATLHAAPLRRFSSSQGVVNVPPWMWARRDVRRPRILVVDDNRTNLMIVRRMLEQAGYDVEEKQTGKAAFESLCGGIYRLAILDMHMPDMSGTDVLRQYRIRCPHSRLPTIILTANVSLDAQQRSADAGADSYLAKPVTAANLLSEVDRLIKETQIETLIPATSPKHTAVTDDEPVLQTDVLTELDRLYQDPRGLAQIIEVYEYEGKELLEKIVQACDERDHAAFSDWMHALRGNAANVGAVKLAQYCSDSEAAGVIDFTRQRDQSLSRLRAVFSESLHALQTIMHDSKSLS